MRKKKNRVDRRGAGTRVRLRWDRIIMAACALFFMIAGVILLLTRCGKESEEYSPEYEDLPDTSEESYGVFLGVDEKTFSIGLFDAYDIVVIDAQELRPEQLAQLHARGHTVYSYLNVGSIEKSRDYFEEYRNCCLDRYDNWPDEFWVDVTQGQWQKFVTEDLPEVILEKDPRIDGLFLDNLDIYSHVLDKRKYRSQAESVKEALSGILQSYQDMGLPVLVNGADVFVRSLIEQGEEELIYGVNQETVFSMIKDYDRDRFGAQPEEERKYYLEYLKTCSKAGLEVFLLEYTDDPELESEILNYCKEKGYRCYISAHVNLSPVEDDQ